MLLLQDHIDKLKTIANTPYHLWRKLVLQHCLVLYKLFHLIFHLCSFTVLNNFRDLNLSELCFISLRRSVKQAKACNFFCRPLPCYFHIKKDAAGVEKLDYNRTSSAKRNFYERFLIFDPLFVKPTVRVPFSAPPGRLRKVSHPKHPKASTLRGAQREKRN